jgi:hypothetical protein
MCIIVVKPRGLQFPRRDILEWCWDNNPDGAGFMFAHSGLVYIQKGFMSLDAVFDALDGIPESLPVVLHFRLRSNGPITPALCHPFAVRQRRITALYTTCRLGVAHNGIIDIEHSKRESDTVAFIREVLAHNMIRQNLDNPVVHQIIEFWLDWGRLAFMNGGGAIQIMGNGWVKHDGLLFSRTPPHFLRID